jgi:hypothetical protein
MASSAVVAQVRLKTRFIMELRYDPVPEFFDVRGKIIAEMHRNVKSFLPFWQSESGQIVLTNSLENNKDQLAVSSRRVLFALEDPPSVEVFIERAIESLHRVHGLMGVWWPAIQRLGVRFIEVVKSPHPTYEATRSSLIELFHKTPVTLPLTYIDSQAILVHERGRYGIGPTKRGDDWTKQAFQDDSTNVPDIGVAVDVDSYAPPFEVKDRLGLTTAFKGVVDLTLAVEESVLRAAHVIK